MLCFVVAVLSLPLMLQGKAKERHELFSQGQSLGEIALATAQVAGKPPTVRSTRHVLLYTAATEGCGYARNAKYFFPL